MFFQSTQLSAEQFYYLNTGFFRKHVLRCTEAFLLHSGYHQLPRRKRIWEMKPDCRNEFIAKHITRDQVDAMLA